MLRANSRVMLFCTGSILAAWSALAQADDGVGDVEAALERVEQALENEPGLAAETKDALKSLVNALKAERESEAMAAPAAVSAETGTPALPEELPLDERSLRDRVEFYGDLRLRYESQFEQDTAHNRHRGRVRLRTGVNVAVHEQVTAGARLTTGDPEDITSANQTLDDVFDKFEISLDRAFLKYTPDRLPGSYLIGGKFGAPWRSTPIFGGITWDDDAQPEGVAAGYTIEDAGPFDSIYLAAVQLFVEETSGTEDAYGTVFQAAAGVALTDTLHLEGGVTYYSWSDIEIDNSTAYLLSDNSGNSVVGGELESDFGVLHPYVVLRYDGWWKPVILVGEYVNNLRANNDDDTGWSLGLALGEAKRRGDWQAFYQWVALEQDSVLTVVNTDDFTLHSGFRGHHFGLAYQLTDRIQFKPNVYTYFREHPNAGLGQTDDYQWKTRLDLNIKF